MNANGLVIPTRTAYVTPSFVEGRVIVLVRPSMKTTLSTQTQITELLAALCALAADVEHLRELVANTPRLHRKDLLARYGISQTTLDRRIRSGTIPAAIRFPGPLWRLADLESAEARTTTTLPVCPFVCPCPG